MDDFSPKLKTMRPEFIGFALMAALILAVLGGRIYWDQTHKIKSKNFGNLPPYIGRDLREWKIDPKEVAVFSSEQLSQLHQKLLDAAGSIDVNADQLDPWIIAGLMKHEIGDNQGARDAWEYASLIRPKNIVSFINLGDLYFHDLPNFPRAELMYKTAIQNDAKVIRDYVSLSDLYRYSYQSAGINPAAPLLEGLQKNPNNEDLTSYAAEYYEEIGNKTEAIFYFRKLMQIDPAKSSDVEQTLKSLGA
ncbi:MAG: hypothetical protein HY220_00370 [Candidatus Sungbacteria bacterium]|uniref:Tetratricopeptide repeat protein n=1 Tax=Candidatus Sungiibacteriota bacterium TaxID=2750080 RepID=A0A9D6LR64_9BACT|nr:hypothetical protein [Candidatus Sungbacteria bacterium]